MDKFSHSGLPLQDILLGSHCELQVVVRQSTMSQDRLRNTRSARESTSRRNSTASMSSRGCQRASLPVSSLVRTKLGEIDSSFGGSSKPAATLLARCQAPVLTECTFCLSAASVLSLFHYISIPIPLYKYF